MTDSDQKPVDHTSANKESAESPSFESSKGFGTAFWGTLVTLLILIGGIELYAAFCFERYVHTLADPAETQASSASDQSKPIEGKSSWRDRVIQESFSAAEREYVKLGEELHASIKRDLAVTRAAAISRIPEWADWYYSVIGEYVRLGHLAGQAIGAGEFSDYLVEQITERIFEPAGLSTTLVNANERARSLFADRHDEVTSHLREVLNQQASQVAEEDAEKHAQLERQMSALQELDQLAIVSPVGIAAKVTTITGLKMLIKTLAARSAVKAGSTAIIKTASAAGVKAGGKLGVKAGLRGTTAASSGAAATVACAPLGLAAPVCGVGAAIITWFAVDKAIVEIDELINRDDYEAQMRSEINMMMDEIEQSVLQGLDDHQKLVIETLMKSHSFSADQLPSTRLVDQLSPKDTQATKDGIQNDNHPDPTTPSSP